MSIALADRRHVPEAADRPTRLAFKTGSDEDTESATGKILSIDEHEGIVTAVVSVTGIEDEVADIIVPGAYAETLTKRRPKVCWAHSWEQPIGRVLYIEELMPGDERLPRTQRDGKAWPKDAGALIATMQFNLRSDAGREAFAAVLFYSESGECEYSIGYQVPAGKSTRDKAGVRHIKSLNLFELSVVLFGAHTMTGTLSIKAATALILERKSTGTGTAAIETKSGSSDDGHTPPAAARTAAQKGLDLRAKFNRGGTPVGVARARDIAGGKSLPIDTVKRMSSFFARHEPDKAADGWGSKSDPSAGYIAWLLWGGDPAASWVKGILSREEKADEYDADLDYSAMTETKATGGGLNDTEVGEALGGDDPDGVPDFSDGVMVAVYPDSDAAAAIIDQIAGPDATTPVDDLHVTLAYLGSQYEVDMEAAQLIRVVTAAVEGLPVLDGEIAGLGVFPDSGDGAPTWAPVDVAGLGLLREVIVEALGDSVRTDHGFTPHMTLGYDLGMISPIESVPVTFTSVRVVYGNQQHDITLGQVVNGDEVKDAAAAADAPPAAEAPAVEGEAVAVESVETVGSTTTAIIDTCPGCAAEVRFDLANGWQAMDGSYSHEADGTHGDHLAPVDEGDDLDGALAIADLLASMTDSDWDTLLAEIESDLSEDAIKAMTPGGREGDDSPLGTPGGTQNWVDKAGGLPRYIRMVANALKRKGMETSRAIATAVNTIKRWAANVGGKVSPKVQAAAAAALAEWEAKKGTKATAYDPTLDRRLAATEAKAAMPVPGVTVYPYLEGSFEARQALIRRAVTTALQGEETNEEGDRHEWDHVDLRGTWDDHVLVTRMRWSDDAQEHYQIAYQVDDDGEVALGEAQPITMQVVAFATDVDAGGEIDEADDVEVGDIEGLPDEVDRVSFLVKTALAGVEIKAGRVLSGRNERALREVVQRLIEVLAAAGVEITQTDDEHRRAERNPDGAAEDTPSTVDPSIDVETTSPTASTLRHGKSILDDLDDMTVPDMNRLIEHYRSVAEGS